MNVKELPPNPDNPRKITDEQKRNLRDAIERFGPLDGFIFNKKLNRLTGGHQRQAVLDKGEIIIERLHPEPTKQGTIAEGYVETPFGRFPYRETMWDEEEDLAANIAANAHGGSWDFEKLTPILHTLELADFPISLIGLPESMLGSAWDGNPEKISKVEENLDGIKSTIRVLCPSEIKDEVLITLKRAFLETSLEGIEIV